MEEHAKVAGLGRFHLIANEEDAASLQSESLLTKGETLKAIAFLKTTRVLGFDNGSP